MKRLLRIAAALLFVATVFISGAVVSFASEIGTTENLKDGEYTASVFIDSRMMKIAAEDNNTCVIRVRDGKATAHIRLNGDGYSMLYLGKKEAAAQNKDETGFYKAHEEKAGGRTVYSYDIPVEEFGKIMDLAALGTKWYDRQIVFYADEMASPEITGVKKSKNLIEIRWSDKPEYATGYQVAISSSGNFEEPMEYRIENTVKNAFTISGLDADETVHVRVRAEICPFDDKLSASYSEWTEIEKITTLIRQPATSIKTAASPAKRTLKITWTKKTADVDGYQIIYSTNSSFQNGKTVTINKNTITSRMITRLTSGKKYYVKIRTYQNVGGKRITSSWSAKKIIKVK